MEVGVKQDLSREEIEKLAGPVRDTSARLYEITGGVMYIQEVIFSNRTARGDFIYDREFGGTPSGWTNIKMGPANWGVGVILHEYGHAEFGLDDEYKSNMSAVDCENCIMALRDKGFCSAKDHTSGAANAPGCQELLTRKYPRLAIGFARLRRVADLLTILAVRRLLKETEISIIPCLYLICKISLVSLPRSLFSQVCKQAIQSNTYIYAADTYFLLVHRRP